MRYHIHARVGLGPSGDVMVGVGDWLGAEPVAIRYLSLSEDRLQNLRVHAERLAMIGHPRLGLIEDISENCTEGVLVATTLGDTTLADSPLDAEFERLLAVTDDVTAALDALHRIGLHHGHVSPSNVVFRDGVTLLGDTGLKTFRGREPVHNGVDRRRRDLVDLANLTAALGWELPARDRARGEALLALCRSTAAAAEGSGSPREHLAAFRQGLDRVASLPVSGATVSVVVPSPATGHVPADRWADTPPAVPERRAVRSGATALRGPVAAAAFVVLVLLGAVAGARWTSGGSDLPTVSPLEPASADGTVARSLTTTPADACAGRAADLAVPEGARAVAGDVDLDGDGCPELMTWTPSRAELTVHLSAADEGVDRFHLGEPGDEFVVGDWDCSGRATPGLYRPSTGATYLFDRWASTADPAAASVGPVLDADLTPTVDADDAGCEEIIARRPGW